MLSDYFAKNLVFSLLFSPCLTSLAAESSSTESIYVFSNWKMYPSTGDCGGQTLTLVRDIKMQVIRGYLQTYEGNCEDTKVPIANIQLDSKSGRFSFTAAAYVQDGKGGLEISAERRFLGTIKTNRLTGKFEYCPIDNKICNSSVSVVLPAVKQSTP